MERRVWFLIGSLVWSKERIHIFATTKYFICLTKKSVGRKKCWHCKMENRNEGCKLSQELDSFHPQKMFAIIQQLNRALYSLAPRSSAHINRESHMFIFNFHLLIFSENGLFEGLHYQHPNAKAVPIHRDGCTANFDSHYGYVLAFLCTKLSRVSECPGRQSKIHKGQSRDYNSYRHGNVSKMIWMRLKDAQNCQTNLGPREVLVVNFNTD